MSFSGINILILGKTGVGKSSFCNYIFGEKLFRTGKGAPVTGWEEHFESRSVNYQDYRLNIFDSVGIEPNNLKKWRKKLDHFLNERNGNPNALPSDWIHGVFYLINASSARIEPTELGIIRDLANINLPVHVILTNVDNTSSQERTSLHNVLKDELPAETIVINEVCSVSIRKRTGITEPSGKEVILKAFLSNLDYKLRIHIELHFLSKMTSIFSELKEEMRQKVISADLGLYKSIEAIVREELLMTTQLSVYSGDIVELHIEYLNELDKFLKLFKYNSCENLLIDIQATGKVLEDLFKSGYIKLICNVQSLETVLEMFGLEKKVLNEIDQLFRPIEGYLIEQRDKIGLFSRKQTVPLVGLGIISTPQLWLIKSYFQLFK